MTPGTRGREKKFCSRQCGRLSRRKLAPVTSCWSCGLALTDLGKAGFPKRYCNRKCAQNYRIRQEQEARELRSTCQVCLVIFVGLKQGMKYCGPDCRAEANRRSASQRWREEVASRPASKDLECGWCGEAVSVPFSFTGGKKYHDQCKLRARRARDRRKTLLRQGVKSDKRITHEEIAERDGHRCHICGDSVDMSLPRTSKLGATLDHVVPVSRGGVDSLENLKLAHWICNVRKSNKMGDELVAPEAK